MTPRGPFVNGKVDRHNPTLFLLPISFPIVQSKVLSPRRPCVATLSPTSPHSSLCSLYSHSGLRCVRLSLSPSGSSPVRPFALAAMLAWKALPRMAAGPTPLLQASAQTSAEFFSDASMKIMPVTLLPCLLYVSS